jgi:leader peptidase (prepilin peptidase) / N-methyltransferase
MGQVITNIFIFCFGSVIGSFLNVCAYRLPRERSVVKPNSFCPACEIPIKFYDNIPIVSYLFLRAKCRACGARISLQYPAVELITGLLFLMLYWKFGFGRTLPVLMLFVSVLIVISVIDLEFQLIPDVLSIGALVAGVVLAFIRPGFSFLDALFGIALGGGVLFTIAFGYQFVTKREGMGGGDIKLIAMIGAFCGMKGVLFSIICASLLGTIVGIPLMLIKGKDSKYAIPFGPFLSSAAVIYLFRGQNIIYMITDLLLHRSA